MLAITIAKRYCGPPNSANGGYVSGLIANAMGGNGEVTLRAPPPLDRQLEIVRNADDSVELCHGRTLLATGRPSPVDIGEIPAVGLAEAAAAAGRTAYADPSTHILPGCFVCGPGRTIGDGLRIFVGRLATAQVQTRPSVAAPWTPFAELAGEDGHVRHEFIWAALDCPSGFACQSSSDGWGNGNAPILLGRMAAHIHRRPKPGEDCIIVAWPTGRDGRKLFARSALLGTDGGILAVAQATWLVVKRQVEDG
jgi:hypothetical protein